MFGALLVAGIVHGLIIGLAALAVTLVFGIARFPNAAAGDTMTAGAYAGLLAHQASGSLALAGGAAVAASGAVSLLGYLLVFRPLARRPVASLLVAAIGVAFVIRAVLGLIFGHQQQVFQVPLAWPIEFMGLRIPPMDITLATVAACALAAAFGVLHLTSIGRQMRAVADDPDLARVSGIRPLRVMIALWLLAGAAAGIAGLMLGVKTVVSPEMGWEGLLTAFAAAILGGIGSPAGAVLAGLLLGIAQEVSTPYVGFTYKIALAFVVMLAVLLVRPRGLFGRMEGVR
ncbi:ABC transporter permease subunit [Neoroseomonas oryzicola]|uniref:Branched-chain amino acid ABC transporter permease n=1 Tax=Neoroseomonas oryzicola TaxID=535904 RepID=A0A9X9WBM1_9PROT|nr:branched-chain amino acid ABC transporter permease [Neoroseomonas oryzicola]NKE18987.1 branched-chain amino acid ABC transporter permease [Neoroseomonas oryzicola]